jgi:phosphoribosylglycinamide formyltransferase-1
VKRIAILASGAGSNAENILHYFKESDEVEVTLIATNRADAGVLSVAQTHQVETYILTRSNFLESSVFADFLVSLGVDWIVLAGFLWKVPPSLIERFNNRIINIHPSLLPKFGGKGMYGHHVHEAVHAARETKSGITIHYVNEHYDEGAIIAQFEISIEPNDGVAGIERKVRSLEILHFPRVIEGVLTDC